MKFIKEYNLNKLIFWRTIFKKEHTLREYTLKRPHFKRSYPRIDQTLSSGQ